MTDVIGMDPAQAKALLEAEGQTCLLRETRSKKGIENGKPYVIRCQQTPEGTVLTWSFFANDN